MTMKATLTSYEGKMESQLARLAKMAWQFPLASGVRTEHPKKPTYRFTIE